MVTVLQMSGTHSIVNVPTELNIQIRTTWFNFAEGEQEESTTLIPLPPGNYTYESMLAFLNTELPTFADFPYPDTVYGLGGVPFVTTVPQNVPVTKNEVNTKLIFTQFADILTQVIPGPAGTLNQHQYNTFEIVSNRELYQLLVMLGLVEIQNPLALAGNIIPAPNLVIRVTPSSSAFDPINNETTITYDVLNNIAAEYSFDFSGTKSLYVYLETQVNTQFRSPFEGNNASNLIARVPINVIFGEQFTYAPAQVLFSQQRNLNITNLQVTCRDDYGHLVDFQNIPWFLELAVKFGVNESSPNVSGTTGVPSTISGNPSLHASAAGYGDPRRDVLFSSSQNNKAGQQQKRGRINE